MDPFLTEISTVTRGGRSGSSICWLKCSCDYDNRMRHTGSRMYAVLFIHSVFYASSFSCCTGHAGVSPRNRAPLSFVGDQLLATQERWHVNLLFIPFVAHLFTLPSLSVNLLFRRGCMRLRRREEEGGREGTNRREETRERAKERKPRWVRTGRIYLTGCYLVTRRGLRLYDSPAWMMLSPMVSALSRHGRALTCR